MAEINPDTQQEYYAGSVDEVIKYCKSLNIDSGRLAAVKPINVYKYMVQA
ncbi:MAG: hypothetical protein IKP65_04670 [Alphaproteobacteria bacterium]|nr:hypothetical protein [Alphaproteobacteria bacterium]